MRLRPGDLVRFKETAYATMWYPSLSGSLATVARVSSYDPSTPDDEYYVELVIHEEIPGIEGFAPWKASLLERVDTGTQR